jgi:hypothetical protein
MRVLKFVDMEVDGINMSDYPKFVDAFVSSATAVLEDGSNRDATEEELNELTEDGELLRGLIDAAIY